METDLEKSVKESYASSQNQTKYEKPIIEKQRKMTFPMDIIDKFNGGKLCVQCSGCHGCR